MAVSLSCPHMVEKELFSSLASNKGTNPIHKRSTLMTYPPFKASPPNTTISGIRVSTYEFWKDKNIWFITLSLPHLCQSPSYVFPLKRWVSISSTRCDLPLLQVPVVLYITDVCLTLTILYIIVICISLTPFLDCKLIVVSYSFISDHPTQNLVKILFIL